MNFLTVSPLIYHRDTIWGSYIASANFPLISHEAM